MFKLNFFKRSTSNAEVVQPILDKLDSNSMLNLVRNNYLDEPIACIGGNISDYCNTLEGFNNIDKNYRLEMVNYKYITLYDFIFGNELVDETSNEIIRFKVLVDNFIKIHADDKLASYYIPILLSTVNSLVEYQGGNP